MNSYDITESTILNFDLIDSTTILNFEIKAYDSAHPLYKILLDWLESFTFGDIF